MNSLGFVKIAWFGKHFGEEPPLVCRKACSEQRRGAGTIFFTGCNLRCVYCQNYQISQENIGENYSVDELTKIMLKLQKDGALNVDLVSPTIWAGQIILAVIKAKKQGLNIPIIWNSNAYEDAGLIKKLKGLVDIYLPDFKYGDDNLALKYSGIKNYIKKAKEAIKEMFLQVGNLKLSKDGVAKKGIIIRHLILPGHLESSFRAMDFIKEIDKNIHISLMSQYEPVYKAKDFSEINRRLTSEELKKIYNYQLELGLENGWIQEAKSHSVFLPDFTKKDPFK